MNAEYALLLLYIMNAEYDTLPFTLPFTLQSSHTYSALLPTYIMNAEYDTLPFTLPLTLPFTLHS